MANVTLEAIQQDTLAMAVAGAVIIANEAAESQGADLSQCIVTISEEPKSLGRVWRIQYGPRDYINCRGGDLIVLVDEDTGKVRQIIRGQ